MLQYLIIIFGLCVFEIISSIDNAVVNAHVLKTMPQKYRRIFLFWGILFAVFAVRGLLPFIIVWIANPALTPTEIFTFAFSNDRRIADYVEQSKPFLLLAGGAYLFFIFLSWLFLEEKKYAFLAEGFIHRRGMWFYAVSSIFLTLIIYASLAVNPPLALAAAIGASAFFLTDGFRRNAEEQEKKLSSGRMSAWSKILYLEVLDASFSIDGVIGAFAFTISVPLIIIGNGIGALVVRQLTVAGTEIVAKLAYLKNGAMYSIGLLGGIMVLESFGREYPFWFAPFNTTVLLAFFLYLSFLELDKSRDKWWDVRRWRKK